MKKTLLCLVVLMFALAAAAFASRAEIEEVVSSYEAIVVEAENLANQPLIDTSSFTAVDEKAQDAEAKISAVQTEKEWVIDDAKRLAALRERFNTAMAAIVQNLLKF